MDPHVSLAGRGDLADRIYRQLLAAILDGRLRSGERLPPTRELAGRLDVSRNTVAAAYDRLTAEGFLVGRVGAGTYVRAEPITLSTARSAPGGEVSPLPRWQQIPRPTRTSAAEFDFGIGVPDARLFPLETWRRLVGRQLRAAVLSGHYAEPAGPADLRAAIARHVGVSRSVRAGADDVLVTHGAQQALDLLGRVLIEPGSTVAVEDPGYPPARWLFRSLGANVVGVPVDAEGIVVSAIPPDARLVYVTPSHQFPLGTPMSLARRGALLDWAGRRNAVLVEDDYDSEFRFSVRGLEPLQSLDPHGRVVYVGTFSKTLLPMLRLGFLVAPASLRDPLRTAKRLTDWHGDVPTQAALATFINDGLLARHVRRATKVYAARHELISTIVERDFADWLTPVPSASGLHLCTRLNPDTGIDLAEVVAHARRAGVAVQAVGDFAIAQTQPGLVLGYGAIPVELIATGLGRLAASFVAHSRRQN